MSDDHLDKIRAQFTRQAEVYAHMRQTVDESGIKGLVALAQTAPHHYVLDVACGPGFLTMAFASRCAAAVGIDATEALLALARAEAQQRNLKNIEFRSGNAEQLPFADATFDIVSSRAAFHHLDRPERVLAEMKRVAKPGGRVVIADQIAVEDATRAEYHNRIERLCDPTHVRALSGNELEHMFTAAGLALASRIERVVDYDLEEWMAHGGPSPEAAAEIVRLMEDSLAIDRCGLRVRREAGRLCFSHTAAAFLLDA